MAGRAEELFTKLDNVAAVLALLGEAEDAYLDCKEWPARDDDAQKMLAKAACGLSNADGGVLVIGMKAESKPKDEPDVVTSAAPVDDTSLIKSRVLGLIGNILEPGVVGIEVRELQDEANGKSGFVIVYIPKAEGSPHRSRKDWKFYQRIGSSTLPMDYWQIEAMFGRRPQPKLELHVEAQEMIPSYGYHNRPVRRILFGLRNDGAGSGTFPGVRFKSVPSISADNTGLDGDSGLGLPRRASLPDWIAFRGGIDDLIYPGETRVVSALIQSATDKGQFAKFGPVGPFPASAFNQRWVCHSLNLIFEISGEGISTRSVEHKLPEVTLDLDVPRRREPKEKFGRQYS